MPVGHRERKLAYTRLAKENSNFQESSWFANLAHSPDTVKALSRDVLPSLTKGSQLFCLPVGPGCDHVDRYMESVEAMSSLLLPVHQWGARSSADDIIGPSHELCFDIATLPDKAKRALAGNGMNLLQLGACIMTGLGTHVKRERPVPAAFPTPVIAKESDSDLD